MVKLKKVRAQRVDDIEDDSPPGSFEYYTRYGSSDSEIVGMVFVCPCGCGNQSALDFRNGSPGRRPSWMWDGNEDKPTLSPSVLRTVGCKWHGFLKSGYWESVD